MADCFGRWIVISFAAHIYITHSLMEVQEKYRFLRNTEAF